MNFIIENINVLSLYFVKFSLYISSFLVEYFLNAIINFSLMIFIAIHCMFYTFFYLLDKYYTLELWTFNRNRTQISSLTNDFRNYLRLILDVLKDIICVILFSLFRYEMKLTKLLLNICFLSLVSCYEIVVVQILLRFNNSIRFSMKYFSKVLYNEDIEIRVPGFKIIRLLDHIKSINQDYVDDFFKNINSRILSLRDNMIEFFMPIPKFFSRCFYKVVEAMDLIIKPDSVFESRYGILGLVVYAAALMFSAYLFNPEFQDGLNHTIEVLNYEPSGMTSLVQAFFVVMISLFCLILSIFVSLSYSIYELFGCIFFGPCDRLCQIWSLYNLPSEAFDHKPNNTTIVSNQQKELMTDSKTQFSKNF